MTNRSKILIALGVAASAWLVFKKLSVRPSSPVATANQNLLPKPPIQRPATPASAPTAPAPEPEPAPDYSGKDGRARLIADRKAALKNLNADKKAINTAYKSLLIENRKT